MIKGGQDWRLGIRVTKCKEVPVLVSSAALHTATSDTLPGKSSL